MNQKIISLFERIKRKESNFFDNFILIIITLSAVIIGIETDQDLAKTYHTFFYYSDLVVLFIFIFEFFFKLYVYSPKPLDYFKDSWNIFDFSIVILSILPYLLNSSVNVETIIILRILRLARVFRVFRLISILKPLQLLVSTLIHSLPSMGYVALLIMLLFYVYGVIGVFQFNDTDPEHYSTLGLSILTLFQTITGEGWPDLLAIQIAKKNTVFASIYYISFIVLGSMIILNLLIGVIVSELENIKEVDARGKDYIHHEDHIVILGWSDKLIYLISELIEANKDNRNTVICILADRKKYDMKEFFKMNHLHHKNITFHFRTGLATEKRDLEMVNITRASSVIIINGNGTESDASIIKALIVVVNNFGKYEKLPPIAIPLYNIKNDSIVQLVSKKQVYSVLVDDVISRLIAQTCRQAGLSVVYDEILSFEGNEIYSKKITDLEGKRFGDIINFFENASVIGIRRAGGEVLVNPSYTNTVLEPGDEIIALAESSMGFMYDLRDLNRTMDLSKVQKSSVKRETENVLIIGANRLVYSIINELDSYVRRGSKISIYVDKEKFQYEQTKLSKNMRSSVSVEYLDTESREDLENIPFEEYHYVILLTYDMPSVDDADAYVIILWLYIRDILKNRNHPIPIVTEMLNNKNEKLARPSDLDDFIIIDKIDSRLLAQFSQNPYLKQVYEVLFDEKGSEIYLKPAKDFLEIGKEYSIYEVSNLVNQQSDLLIGYKKNSEEEYKDKRCGVVVNPPKSERITFTEVDKLIVISEVEYT